MLTILIMLMCHVRYSFQQSKSWNFKPPLHLYLFYTGYELVKILVKKRPSQRTYIILICNGVVLDVKMEKVVGNFNYFMALYNIYSSLEHDFEANHSVSCPGKGRNSVHS